MKQESHTFWNNMDLKENVQHGNILFPLEKYSVTFNDLAPFLMMHWHPEMELTQVIDGHGTYSIDLQEYEVGEGDYICVQPNLLHAARITPHSSLTTDTFVFHLNLLGTSSADICALHYFSPLKKGKVMLPHIIRKGDVVYSDFSQTFHKLMECYQNKSIGYELEIKSLLFHMFTLLLSHPQTHQAETDDSHNERMKLVFGYIREHFAENISIEDVAELCCISSSHFMHYFKEKTGLTFNQYLNQYRLRNVSVLLQQQTPIAEAAYASGFNNLPYFYKRFQEYYHMTPRKFQELNKI